MSIDRQRLPARPSRWQRFPLGVAERPNLFALHPLGLDVSHRPIMEGFTFLTGFLQQLRYRVWRYVRHASDRVHGGTLAQHGEDLDALGERQLVQKLSFMLTDKRLQAPSQHACILSGNPRKCKHHMGMHAMDDNELPKKPTGKAKGGHARSEKLPASRRSEIAKHAASKRWASIPKADDIPKVLENFKSKLRIAGMEIPCAVLMGPQGVQRVLTENGITNAILGSRSGASKRKKKLTAEQGALAPIFVAPRQLEPFITKELRDGPLRPIDYLDGDRIVRGYDASILVAVCNVWLSARQAGALQEQQLDKAKKAEILIRALAETAIVALVDDATGYQSVRPQGALQSFLELVIRRELAVWAKKFPDEFYVNIYKLKGWVWPGMSKNRYSVVANYTTNLIYDRLGPGMTDELIRLSPKTDTGSRANKLHQWLSDDMGNPMLATHMQSILVLQRLAIANSWGWSRFLRIVDQTLPRRGATLELPLEDPNE
jgi:hypothetical protein